MSERQTYEVSFDQHGNMYYRGWQVMLETSAEYCDCCGTQVTRTWDVYRQGELFTVDTMQAAFERVDQLMGDQS